MRPGLTDAEWLVFHCVARNLRPSQIATELDISPSYVTALLAQLRDKHVIRRKGHHPDGAVTDRRYAYHEVIPGVDPTRNPVVAPDAKLDIAYTVASERNHHAAPIRLIRWRGWSVQGIPTLRPDGKRPKEALPDQCVIYISRSGYAPVLLLAWLRRPWRESDTIAHGIPGVTEAQLTAITQMIAWSIGVEAVLDVTTTRGNTQ